MAHDPAHDELQFEASMSALVDELRAQDERAAAPRPQPTAARLPPCGCPTPFREFGAPSCRPVACGPLLYAAPIYCPIAQTNPEFVRRIVLRQLPRLHGCYQRALIGRGRLEGRIMVHFVVDPNGDVLEARIESSTVAAPELEACTTRTFREMHFEDTLGDSVTVVHYPLTFVVVDATEP